MTNYRICAKEIILKQNKRAAGTETFVYEPSYIEEEALGSLYVIGWLKNHRQDLDFLSNLLASILRREFYKLNGGGAEVNFENALKKANASLADIAKTNAAAAEDIGICATNISGSNIRFAKTGNIVTLLFRDGKVTDMSKQSKADHADNSPRKTKSKKNTFSSVVSGMIYPGDKFIFATEKITDLFSEKGIAKLFSLNLDGQSEIITEIYQKNRQEIPLADQAVILLEIKEPRDPAYLSISRNIDNKITIMENAGALVGVKRRFASLANLRLIIDKAKRAKETLSGIKQKTKTAATDLKLHRKNISILSIAIGGLVLFGFGYFSVNAKINMIRDVNSALINSEKMSKENKDQAIDTLKNAQEIAMRMFSSLYLSGTAERLFKEINIKINKYNGVHIEPPLLVSDINTSALKFSPMFIFDDIDWIYIFGEGPEMYYKISKRNKEQSFVLNHQAQELAETKKIIKELAANESKQKTRADDQFNYHLSPDRKKIIKQEKEGAGKKETFLLGSAGDNVINFTVSENEDGIYILSKDRVWKLKNENI